MRKYVNPDFELNNDLQKAVKGEHAVSNSPYIFNDNLKAMMMQNAHNAEQYSKNLMAYLDLVKKVDADGYRMDEEVATLDSYVREHIAPTQNNDLAQAAPVENIDTTPYDDHISDSMKHLKALMKTNAGDAAQYAQNMKNYLELAQRADADGVRTDEENTLLNAFVAERTKSENVALNAKKNADITQTHNNTGFASMPLQLMQNPGKSR